MGIRESAENGLVVLEPFEDFGNLPEFVAESISAYEILDGGRIRLFCTRLYRGRLELAYTVVMSVIGFEKLGPKFAAILAHAQAPVWAATGMQMLS